MGRLFRTDTICKKCGNIQVMQFRRHEMGINREITTWCYKCQRGVRHILIGDKNKYLFEIEDKNDLNIQEKEVKKLLIKR